MNKKLRVICCITLLGLFTGCASVTPMPLNEDIKELDTTEKSILTGRLRIQNQNKPNHQPTLESVVITKGEEKYTFTNPTLVSEVESQGKDYFFSLASEPGPANLSLMQFISTSFLISGSATLQLNQEVVFPESGIAYIGDITATIIPRKDGQPRAGSVIPLIDQSVTGFSSGTFDVQIADNYEEDVQIIKAKFPYMANSEIAKMILPEWKRAGNEPEAE